MIPSTHGAMHVFGTPASVGQAAKRASTFSPRRRDRPLRQPSRNGAPCFSRVLHVVSMLFAGLAHGGVQFSSTSEAPRPVLSTKHVFLVLAVSGRWAPRKTPAFDSSLFLGDFCNVGPRGYACTGIKEGELLLARNAIRCI